MRNTNAPTLLAHQNYGLPNALCLDHITLIIEQDDDARDIHINAAPNYLDSPTDANPDAQPHEPAYRDYSYDENFIHVGVIPANTLPETARAWANQKLQYTAASCVLDGLTPDNFSTKFRALLSNHMADMPEPIETAIRAKAPALIESAIKRVRDELPANSGDYWTPSGH